MELVTYFFNVPILQAVGIVLLIGLAERMGIPVISLFKSLLKINGNGSTQPQIDELKRHAEVANHEMGEMNQKVCMIEKNIGLLASDVAFIKGKLSR